MTYKFPTLCLSIISVLPFLLINQHYILWTISMDISIIFLGIWVFSVVSKLLVKKPEYVTFNRVRLFMHLFISIIYLIFLSIYFILTYNKTEEPARVVLLMLVGHLFLTYSLFYILKSISRLISSMELKKNTDFQNSIANFILLIFFPIGIWWLNPKIKEIIEG
jgi:hypothetical protein